MPMKLVPRLALVLLLAAGTCPAIAQPKPDHPPQQSQREQAQPNGKGVLRPMDLEPRIIANQWMDWAFTFQGSVRDAFWNLIRTPADKRDMKAVEASRVKSGELAKILDAALADRMYVAGSFTMGDIPIGCEVQRWIRLPIERPKLPNLEAWFERLCARPAFKKNVDLPLT